MIQAKEQEISEKRRLVTNTFYNASAQVIQMAAAFVFMPFLIRLFGPANYGVFLLAGSLTGYLGLLDLGVGTSLTKRVAEYRARGSELELSGVVSSALLFYALAGTVAGALMIVVAVFGLPYFDLTAGQRELALRMLVISALGPPILWPLGVGGQVLGGLQRFDLTAKVAVSTAVANAAITLVVLWLKEGPLFLLVASLLIGTIASVTNLYLAKTRLSTVSFHPARASRSGISSLFSISWAIFIVQLCTVVVYQQTDRLVLGLFVGVTAITMYEAAAKLQGFTIQIASLPPSAVMPAASQLAAEGRMDAIKSMWLRGTKYTSLFVLPIVATLVFLARPIMREWLGEEFVGQALAAQVILSYWFVNVNLPVGHGMLYGLGQMKPLLRIVVGQTALNLILSLILVQRFGIMGVVLGTVLPFFLSFPLHLALQLRTFKVSIREWVQSIVMRVYPVLLVPAALAYALSHTTLVTSVTGIVFAVTVSVGSYWAASVLLSLTGTEKAELSGAGRALIHKFRQL